MLSTISVEPRPNSFSKLCLKGVFAKSLIYWDLARDTYSGQMFVVNNASFIKNIYM